jgi:hypothetical protein
LEFIQQVIKLFGVLDFGDIDIAIGNGTEPTFEVDD